MKFYLLPPLALTALVLQGCFANCHPLTFPYAKGDPINDHPGEIVSPYGLQRDTLLGSDYVNPGIEICSRKGDTLKAPWAGIVTRIELSKGPALLLNDGGSQTIVLSGGRLLPLDGERITMGSGLSVINDSSWYVEVRDSLTAIDPKRMVRTFDGTNRIKKSCCATHVSCKDL